MSHRFVPRCVECHKVFESMEEFGVHYAKHCKALDGFGDEVPYEDAFVMTTIQPGMYIKNCDACGHQRFIRQGYEL